MAAKGQGYGEAGKQMASQSAVPVAAPPTEMSPPPPTPGQMGRLDRMTERPNEPISTGMSFGEGPGPEALAMPTNMGPGSKENLVQQLRVAVSKYPNPNLIQLLLMLEGQ